MKKRIMTALLLAFCTLLGEQALAGYCTNCTIVSLGSGTYFDGICTSGKCVFVDVQAVTTEPSCATNSAWDYVLDMSTDTGKSTYAILMSAYLAGKAVEIGGNGACTLSPSGLVENLIYALYTP
jgi:hypothetical protein